MASPNISFDGIPSSIRKPGYYFEFNTRLAVRSLPSNAQRLLLIAPMLASATRDPLTPFDIFDDVTAGDYFGYGSMAHLMAKAAIRANRYAWLSVIGLADASAGLKASASITLSGTVSQSGIITAVIANSLINAAALKDASSAEVASALALAINNENGLPVSASQESGVITLTAKHAGAAGNLIPLSVNNTSAGLTVNATAFSGGQLDPDISEALAKVYAEQYHVIVSPFAAQDALSCLREHLDSVSGPLEQRGARAVAVTCGTLAGATTLAGQINSGRISLGLLPGTVSLPWEAAAAYGAVVAWEEDPARPLNTLALTGISPPSINKRLSRMEQEAALANGVTPFEVGSGEEVQIVRSISTYTQNPAGIDDPALLDFTTIATLDYVRKAVRQRIALRFPREKLSSRTPAKVRSEIIEVLLLLEDMEIVEEVKANLEGVIVERDQDPNRLNARIPVDIVNGLHVFAGRIDLLL